MDGLITDKPYKDKIQRDFEKFHAEYPGNYILWVKFVWEARGAGVRRMSSTTIWERVKWYITVESRGDYGDMVSAKMSNSFRSRYARLIMQQEIGLAGFFPLRQLVSVY